MELTLPALLIASKNMKEEKKEEKIETDRSLEKYNTMRLKSIADFFLRAKDKEDIVKGVSFAREKGIPFFILGAGSNVIFPSRYEGLVILMANNNFKVIEEESSVKVFAESGAYLPRVSVSVDEKLGKGLEWAGGVPGSVGGAVRGNAGAFNGFMADCVKRVVALNTVSLEEEVFQNKDCLFGYRESVFKKEGKYIILEVEMKFPKKEEQNGKQKEYMDYREKNHPIKPSAGSVFKNPEVDENFYYSFPETEKFKELGFVPARFLIEGCGLAGFSVGEAQVSEKHANFIVNKGDATREDIKKLISIIKQKVKEKFGISITEEVKIV